MTQAEIIQSLSKLLCGSDFSSENEIDEILEHLFTTINRVTVEVVNLPSMTDEKLSLYGPYLGRAMLELGATALLARVDPFRVLVMKGKQKQPGYELHKPHSASVRWQGDVVDEAVACLWSDKSLKNPTRAILGAYQVNLVLIKSVQRIMNKGSESLLGDWYNELIKTDAKGLVEKLKSKITHLYSTLSKGIHHELLIPAESGLDRNAILTLINDVIFVISTLGLIVSHIPHAYHKSSESESLSYYKTAKELEVI